MVREKKQMIDFITIKKYDEKYCACTPCVNDQAKQTPSTTKFTLAEHPFLFVVEQQMVLLL